MRISGETRDRVLRSARELDYRPNVLARALRTSVAGTLAFVSDSVASEAYGGQMVRGALAGALEHGQLLLVLETGEDRAVEENLLLGLLDRGVDGFLYARAATSAVELPSALRGQRVVLLNCFEEAGTGTAVLPDEYRAGRDAARVLAERGHRRIQVVGTPGPGIHAGAERYRGILDELRARGLRLEGTVECEWWPESAYEALAAALPSHPPQGLVCMNDRVALGAYQALQEAGLSVPEDVSVVSFDDSALASWLRPPLSSIGLPYFAMGQHALALLLDGAAGGTHTLPMPVHARRSLG